MKTKKKRKIKNLKEQNHTKIPVEKTQQKMNRKLLLTS